MLYAHVAAKTRFNWKLESESQHFLSSIKWKRGEMNGAWTMKKSKLIDMKMEY